MMIDASQRHGRVRRDDLRETFWADRFMFARRVGNLAGLKEPRDPRDERTGESPRGSSDRRRTAVRIIERIAGELFRIPRSRGSR
jgi:hypothetical protein